MALINMQKNRKNHLKQWILPVAGLKGMGFKMPFWFLFVFLCSCGGSKPLSGGDTQGANPAEDTRASVGQVGICNRTDTVVQSLLLAVRKTECASVTDEDISSLKSLKISFDDQLLALEKKWKSEDNEIEKKKLKEDLEQFRSSAPRLTELKEGDFEGLTSLTNLDLSDNFLEDLPSGVFSPLSELEVLDLSGNQIVGPLNSASFTGLSKVKQLDLSGNRKLGGLSSRHAPDGLMLSVGVFTHLSSLQNLDLSDCMLHHGHKYRKDDLPSGVFKGLGRLNKLNLANNELERIHKSLFEDLKSVKTVDMKGNRFDSSEQRRITRDELPNSVVYF